MNTNLGSNRDHPLGYLDQAAIEWYGNDDIERMVGEYDPDGEFVTILFKVAGRRSTYRVQLVLTEHTERVGQQAEYISESSDSETLMAWQDEGGCEVTDGC